MLMHFQDYLETVRPRLEDAFGRELSNLLGNITLRDASSLMAAIEGGKKIRGCLSFLVSDALGGDFESAIPRAVAVELTVDDLREIEEAASRMTVQGARYPELPKEMFDR
jgi:geranylgeranyl pyrophosphate synthase